MHEAADTVMAPRPAGQDGVVLYDYWRSTASYRVRIALNLAGLAYRAVPVDLRTGAQSSDAHLARNPQGLVPVLEIDGLRLTQSMAILDYLEDTRRVALCPDGAGARARMRAVVQTIACDIHPVCNLRILSLVAATSGRDDTAPDWIHAVMRPGLQAVEAQLDPVGPFAMGETLSQADVLLIPQLYNAARWGVPTDDLPRITRVAAACAALPAFVAAHPDAVRPDHDH